MPQNIFINQTGHKKNFGFSKMGTISAIGTDTTQTVAMEPPQLWNHSTKVTTIPTDFKNILAGEGRGL